MNPVRPRATSPAAVRDLIRGGIPEAGMPAFPASDEELDSITAYVMPLRAPAAGPSAGEAAPGNASAGEKFFAGKGNCASCHMVQSRGGVLGPDLSNEGRERIPAQIEQALRNPGSLPANEAASARSRNSARGRSAAAPGTLQ